MIKKGEYVERGCVRKISDILDFTQGLERSEELT
jgi:hypothetical protein